MSVIQKLNNIKSIIDNTLNKNNNTLTDSVQSLKDKSEIFYISTKEDLELFIKKVNSGRSFLNGVLTNNINLGQICKYDPTAPSGDISKMIGSAENPYRGIFDGQNYTITISATVNHRHSDGSTGAVTDDFRVGLFNSIENATIKNLIVEGDIVFDHQNSTNTKVAGICAYAKDAIFNNCINKVNITGIPNSSSSGVNNVGGIIGYVCGTLNMTQCGNEGNQKIHGNYQGGLIGYQDDSTAPSLITECYNHGTIEGYRNVGGLIGRVGGCQQIGDEVLTTQIFDLQNWVQQMKEDSNIWNSLRETSDENIKWIGYTSTKDTDSSWKNSYNELLKLNNNFNINESISNFSNVYWAKRLYLNSNPNETYPWILAYYSSFNNTPDTTGYYPERSQLTFNINNENEGYYNINFEVALEEWSAASLGKHEIFEDLYPGGGTFDVEVNGQMIATGFSCKGTNRTITGRSTTQVYLQQGENVVSLYRNSTSRHIIYLKSFEIAPCQESFVGRSYDISLETFEDIEESTYEIIVGAECIEKIDVHQPDKGESLVNDYLHKFVYTKTDGTQDIYYYLRFKTIAPGAIKLIVKSKANEIKYILNLSVSEEKNLIRTSILKNCYNNGMFNSYNYYNTETAHKYSAHYSGGLFGNVNLKVSSLYHGLKIANCYVSGITPEAEGSENRDCAIFAGCSSSLAGIFENNYYLKDCGRDPSEFDALDPDNYYGRVAQEVEENILSNYYFTETSLTKPFIFLGKYPVLNWEYNINEANRQMIENAGPEVYYTENQIGVGAFTNKYNLKQIILPEATILPPFSLDVFYGGYDIENNIDLYGRIDKVYVPKCSYIQDYACPSIKTFDTRTSITISKNGFTTYMQPGYGIEFLILRSTKSISTLTDIEAFLNSNIYNKLEGNPIHDTPYTGIYVPASLLEQYKTATNWSYYSKVIHSIEGIEYDEIINSSTSTEEEIEQAKLNKAEVLKITGGWVV